MDDRTLVRSAVKIEQFVSGALDGEIKSMLTKKALLAGACMAIPLWGIETIIYAFLLWGAYSRISDISGVPFRENFIKNVLGGFVINILVTFVLCLVLDFIPVLGWIGSFAVGYISIYASAMGYVKALKAMHGKRAKADVNVNRGVAFMKQGTSSFKSDLSGVIDKGSEMKDKITRILE